MKRLFIATKVELGPYYKQLVAQLQYAMRHDEITWVKEEVSHLTLRFLGATPDQDIPAIKASLQRVCEATPTFDLELNRLGAFGSRYKPMVLWLGFENFVPFQSLFEQVEKELTTIGLSPAYGNFVPHITLGRVKQVIDKSRFWKGVEACQPQEAQRVPVCEMTLYQSFLHKEGPEYKSLASYRLRS